MVLEACGTNDNAGGYAEFCEDYTRHKIWNRQRRKCLIMLNVKVTLFIVLLLSLRLIIHGITLMKVFNSLYVSFYLFSFSFVLFFRFHCPLSCTDHWSFFNARWDYQVTGPSGERVHDFDCRSTAMFEFVAYRKGLYKFCFTNKSPYHETLDFDIHVAHYA